MITNKDSKLKDRSNEPNLVKTLERLIDTYQEIFLKVGICPECLEIPQMHDDGPFSHCKCGMGEDYARRPLQELQILKWNNSPMRARNSLAGAGSDSYESSSHGPKSHESEEFKDHLRSEGHPEGHPKGHPNGWVSKKELLKQARLVRDISRVGMTFEAIPVSVLDKEV